jgi:hypothetical protein
MLIIPPIIAALMIQKRKNYLIIFGVISITAAILYFYGLDNTRMSNYIWGNIHIIIANFFCFIGCNLWIQYMIFFSLFAGITCVVVYLCGIWNKMYKKDLFCFASITFFLLTAGAVVLGNEPVLSGESVAPWRYRTYGSIFLVLTAIILVNNAEKFRLKKAIYTLPILALIFSSFSTAYCYRKAERRLELRQVTAYHWHKEGKRLGTHYPQVEPELIVDLKKAEQMGLYKMPQYPLSEYKSVVHFSKDKNKQSWPEGILYAIENLEEREDFLLIEGWAYLQPESMLMESEDIYLYLVNEDNQLVCRPNFERRFDIIDDTRKADCGFFAVIDKTKIPVGIYRIEIGVKSRFRLNRPVFHITTNYELKR